MGPTHGGGKFILSNAATVDTAGVPRGIHAMADKALSGEFVATFDDTIGSLLAKLADERQREIAIHKMGGMTNSEIADELGCPLRTIERKLSIIRSLWQKELNA